MAHPHDPSFPASAASAAPDTAAPSAPPPDRPRPPSRLPLLPADPAAARLMPLLPAVPALLVLDFDGVMTDNAVWVDETGRETVRCSRGDGLGLTLLRRAGFPVWILSTEENPVVMRRAEKLKLPCRHGIKDKTAALAALLAEVGAPSERTIFVGNDVNDIGCLRLAGCGLVVADAHAEVMRAGRGVLSRPGGHGAVREVCDAILARLGVPQVYNPSDGK